MDKKVVMMIDEALPLGLIANTAAVLATTFGKEYPSVVGQDVCDENGVLHKGIITIPIPILKGTSELLSELVMRLQMDKYLGVETIRFSDIAQSCKTYDEYIDKMQTTAHEELQYLGILLYGDKKLINKLSGSLPLLR